MRANTLRSLADKYRLLANSADSAGHFALAASHARMAEMAEQSAIELEAKYAEPEVEEHPVMRCDGCGAIGRHDGRNFVWTVPDPKVVKEHRATCGECHRAYVLTRRKLWRRSGRDRRQMPSEYQGK